MNRVHIGVFMKLCEWDFAPNCLRVRMYLFEKGIEVEREECITPDIILKEDYRDPIPQIPDLITRGKKRVASFHKKFNDQLAEYKYVAGDYFSVANITTICVVDMGMQWKCRFLKARLM